MFTCTNGLVASTTTLRLKPQLSAIILQAARSKRPDTSEVFLCCCFRSINSRSWLDRLNAPSAAAVSTTRKDSSPIYR